MCFQACKIAECCGLHKSSGTFQRQQPHKGCLGFNKGPLRVTTSSQSQLEVHLFPSVSFSIWYFLYSVVQGSNSGQLLLWMVRIKQELLLCVGRLSAHLTFKAPSVLMGDSGLWMPISYGNPPLWRWCGHPLWCILWKPTACRFWIFMLKYHPQNWTMELPTPVCISAFLSTCLFLL